MPAARTTRRRALRAGMRRLGAVALAGATLAGITLSAAAGPAAADLRTPEEARRVARTIESALLTPSGWTGEAQSCRVGTESARSLRATRRVINSVRRAAGLRRISLRPDLDDQARAAALMMLAQGRLSHEPTSDWACHSEVGSAAAARSNLFGTWGAVRSGGDAVLGYVADRGFDSLGHRRVVLSPGITSFGTGTTVDMTARESTNALLIGNAEPAPPGSVVAWPPKGYVVASWLPERWSLSLGGQGETVDASAAQVTMTLDGKPMAISGVSTLGRGWDTSEAIAWTPKVDAAALVSDWVEGRRSWDEPRRLRVRISGVTVNGVARPIAYTVRVIYATAPASLAPTSPQGPARASVRLTATRGGDALRVDVDPDRGRGYWRFQVEQRSAGAWRALPGSYRTRGARETRTLDLPAGSYRVVVLPRYGRSGATSDAVTLER